MDESQHTDPNHADAPSILEQKLAWHIAHTPLAYIEWDLDFAVVDWNPAAERIFGYSKAEAVGRHAGELIIAPEVRPLLGQIWRELIESRTHVRSINDNVTRDGHLLHCEWFNSPLIDADGKVTGVVSLVENVTGLRQAEEERLRAAQKLALHIKNTPMAYVEWDTTFTVVEWNPAAERIFGFSRAEALGRHAAGLIVPAEARPIVDQVWADLLRQHGGTRSSNDNVTKDGRTIHCEWYNTPLVDYRGTVIGVASLIQDVTEQRDSEVERQRLQEQIIHAQQTALAELSTPLIPVSDEIVIMPLIGSLDSQRAQAVLDTLLQGVSGTRARVAILDITGVPVVDTQIANVLLQAARSVQLLGAQVVLTGIRPEVAQTMVGLGVEMRGLVTRSNLQSGIAYAMSLV
ncbi:MAG TPA: PAS domain S-box protein [Herpetosiphonaceae bacterium]|nr:PAS domain S-box protein [Herpetosiphonaceae bacterium]